MEDFKCKICDKVSNSLIGLATHIGVAHKIDKKLYYTKYMNNPVGICECGKETKFRGMNVGFDKFCSNKCAANSKETREKYAETCITKYGVDSASKTEAYKEHVKETNINNFGVECVFQTKEFKEKSKRTCRIKYGTEYSSQNDSVKETLKQTCIDKYGVSSVIQLPSVIESRNNALKHKFKKVES